MDRGKKIAIGLGVGAAVITGVMLLTRKAAAAPPTPEPGLASLSGIVSDASSGQPIQGVSVTLGTASTSTNASGGYSFNNIVPGIYQMTVSKSGYVTRTL